jgi:poly(hydroxyalkanoate) granule-associated protein
MARVNGRTPPTDNQLVRLIRDSAGHAWDAGIDVYSRAESGGSRLIDGLLGIRERLDRGARDSITEARSSALEAWERIEYAFAQRVSRSLNALQIPTARDVQELNARIEALQRAVSKLERRAAQMAAPKHRAGTGRRQATQKAAKHAAARAPARARKAGDS